MATVYMTKDISPTGLLRAYDALGRVATGKVAVKIHSGEPGGHNYLNPALIGPLVYKVKGTIVECDTVDGLPTGRSNSYIHHQVLVDHGFTAIAPVDIMDEEGEIQLPIKGGKHLPYDIVGSHLANYTFLVNLAHFKGHMMGGFGGVLKNQSIGVASPHGKAWIHSAGKVTSGLDLGWPQDPFTESMAEAAKGVADHFGENILYIDIMNNISVDCDCMPNPEPPCMKDIGILSSLDPVSLDQAAVDLIYKAPDGARLIERMEWKRGVHILEHAEAIGLGSRKYELVSLDA
jgi:uncharacterized Fe-S center protein